MKGTETHVQVNSYPVREPLYARRSFSIELLSFLWALTPPVIAAANLPLTVFLYGEPFSQYFAALAIIVFGLTALVVNSPQHSTMRLSYGRFQQTVELLGRWTIVLFVLLMIGYVVGQTGPYARRVLLTWAVTTPALIVGASLGFRLWLRRLVLDESNRRRAVIAGYNEASQSLASRLRQYPELCMSLRGYFDDRNPERLGNPAEGLLLGQLQELVDYVKRHHVDVIFISLPLRNLQRVVDLLDELRDTTASIYYVPDIFVFDLIQARTADIQGVPVVALCESPFHGSRGVSKRLFDIVLSAALLLLLSPALLLTGLLVKWSSPGPILFKQRRYGLAGDEFIVYKFRTMTVLEDGAEVAQATRDDVRTTTVGRFLRRYSIDELPQLANVLQGRMSLIGPRPHAVAHNEMYRKLIKGYMVRHKVLPGITGLAQVNGLRGETKDIREMEARVHYDLEYLRHWSPLLDLKILCMTLVRVFTDKRAY
jgi:putative colanic acid biosynthesis UDP-glucose lipid carrier transferase